MKARKSGHSDPPTSLASIPEPRTQVYPPVKAELSPICWRYRWGPGWRAACWEGLISTAAHVAQITSFCFSFTCLCEISGNHIWLLLTLWRLWVISQSPEFWMWKWCVIYSWRVKRITRSDNGEGIPSVVLLWTNSNRQNIHLRKLWRHSVFGLEGKPDPWRSSEEWGTLKNVFLAGSLQIRCPGRQSLSL